MEAQQALHGVFVVLESEVLPRLLEGPNSHSPPVLNQRLSCSMTISATVLCSFAREGYLGSQTNIRIPVITHTKITGNSQNLE